jgi:maltose alpha-D-glucosyltransferase/alpha-amylase
VVRPVIGDRVYGYQRVNVADQRRDPQSMLNWTERMIRARKECPEISWGNFTILRTNVPEVLVMRYDWRETSLVTMHNFSGGKRKATVKIGCPNDDVLVEVFDSRHSHRHSDGAHHVPLDGYAWRWFRVGGADNALGRSDLDLTNPRR